MPNKKGTSPAKKFLSFFIETEEETTTTGNIQPSSSNGAVNMQTDNTTTMVAPSQAGTIDKKFYEHFDQLLKDANLPGPDYYEFKQQTKTLSKYIKAEDQLILAAWEAYLTNGGSIDKSFLENTAKQYIDIMNKDKESFIHDVEATMKDKVGTLEQKVVTLETENKDANEQIAKLQEKIRVNTDTIGTTKGDISQSSYKIKNSENSYMATHASYVSEINNDINKINLYIK